MPVRANQQRSSENVAKKKARAAHELPFFISEVLISEAHTVPTDSSLCGAVRRQQINKRRPRRAKRRAQLKLVSLRFGDAVRHEEYGTGLVFDMERWSRRLERALALRASVCIGSTQWSGRRFVARA